MGQLKAGDFVKPLPGADDYLMLDSNMELGLVVGSFFDEFKADGEILEIVPIVNDFENSPNKTEIAFHEMFGGKPAKNFLSYLGEAKYFREATAEEVEPHAKAISAYYAHPFASLEEGSVIKFNESNERRRVTAGKEYVVSISEHSDGGFVITDDDGERNNGALFSVDFTIVGKSETTETEEKTMNHEFKEGDYIVALPEADAEYAITDTNMKLGVVLHAEIPAELADHREEVNEAPDLVIAPVAHAFDSEHIKFMTAVGIMPKPKLGMPITVESKYFRKATDMEVAEHSEEVAAYLDSPIVKVKAGDKIRFKNIPNGAHVSEDKEYLVEEAIELGLPVKTVTNDNGDSASALIPLVDFEIVECADAE